MGKILFFLPKQEDRNIVAELFYRSNDGAWQLDMQHVTGAKAVIDFQHKSRQADAIVARGVTAKAIKLSSQDAPVIDLSVTGYDIMDAALECCTRYHARSIGLVGAEDMIFGGKRIEKYLGVIITPVAVEGEEDAEYKIRKLLLQGITSIVGGGMAVQIGGRLGMNTVFIQSGPEAIYQAIREAKRVAEVRQTEQERSQQLSAILDYSAEGIVAVDKAGAINLINKAALRFGGLTKDVIGTSAAKLIPQMESVLKSGKAEMGCFQTIGGLPMAINCVPIKIKDLIAGTVATFQPVAIIQEVEGQFRRKLHQRGLVAKFSFDDVFAVSKIMRETIALAEQYSAVDSNVLILGETGTGKEIFAQSIHNASLRKQGPFVPVNCAALPETLLESELFGYAEGAFTGASKGGKTGLFEQAHRGTIFLDEISEISMKIQGQLLRVLQEREIRRLGDDRVIPVEVRVIAATNRDLHQLVKEGQFRADLYYRLDILRLNIPALRERPDDILFILQRFMEQYAYRFNRPCRQLSHEAQNLILGYSWPGNVRELRNIAERLTVFSNKTDAVIETGMIQAMITGINYDPEKISSRAQTAASIQDLKQASDLAKIEQALRATNFNVGKAAVMLGMSRTTLWRRVKCLGLNIHDNFEIK